MNKIYVLLIFLLSSSAVFAQKGTIRGNVFEAATGEPVVSALVFLEGTKYGTSTDLEGFYNIAGIEPGAYKLVVRYINFDTTYQEINVLGGKAINVNFNLVESAAELGGVEISAAKKEQTTEVKASVVTVTPKQIGKIPSVGGVADLAQYLQVIPGVVFTGDQGGQLYIRGGAPVQNRVLLDGMTIFNPFHSIGFYSVFETDIIRGADVYTGGFGAEYGGRTSAVIDVTTREGNKKNFGGKIEVSPFMAKVLAEGPLMKMSPKGTSLSYLLTAKHSYLPQSSKALYSYVAPQGLPFGFTDFYGKLSFNSGNGSRVNAFGFNHRDDVTKEGVASYKWNSSGGGVNFRLVPGESKIIINGIISYSQYSALLKEGNSGERKSDINQFNANLFFTNFIPEGELRYGLEISGMRTDLQNASSGLGTDPDNTSEMAAYVKVRKKIGRLVIDPSVRMQFYASLGEATVEPRLGLKYNINEYLRLKAAGGLYTQSLISLVNEQDIVNFFVGYLATPSKEVYEADSKTTAAGKRYQTSVHAIGGLEVDIPGGVELNIEPYLKQFPQIVNLNRNYDGLEDTRVFIAEKGKAYGLDLSAKYSKKGLYLYLAYSLGYVKRNDGQQEYYAHFDRRHNANVVASYEFGKKKSKDGDSPWEVSARWNMGTGFPFTLTQGFYQSYNFDQGIFSNYVGGDNNLGILYNEERNTGRLPVYHRLDLSVKRIFEFGKRKRLEITAGATNAYNRKNIFYFDRIRYQRVDQLPILPSLAMSFTF